MKGAFYCVIPGIQTVVPQLLKKISLNEMIGLDRSHLIVLNATFELNGNHFKEKITFKHNTLIYFNLILYLKMSLIYILIILCTYIHKWSLQAFVWTTG